MIIYELKKLHHGKVELRSIDLKKFIEQDGVEVHHDGKKMFLSPTALKNGKITLKNVQSQFGGHYDLVSFNWKPKDERQGEISWLNS